MPQSNFIVFATLGAVLVIFIIYLFIYLMDRSPYLGWWTLGWFLYLPVNLLSYLFEIPGLRDIKLLAFCGLFFLLNSICNFIGTLLFLNKRPAKWFFYGLFVIVALLVVSQLTANSVYPLMVVIIIFVGLIRLSAGIALLKISQKGSLLNFLGWAYLLSSTNIGAWSYLYLDGTQRMFVLFIFESILLFLAVGFLMLYIKLTHEGYKQDELMIKYYNIHDKLTGTYNRDYYEDVIKKLENNPHKLPLSLILSDINGLKLVNDTLGHKQGDELLKQTAKLLVEFSRHSDLVVRWGGDEFLVILPCTNWENSLAIAERYRQALDSCQSEPIPLSIAMGVATLNTEGESMEDVFRKAEENMYANKFREGNNNKLAIINALGQLLFDKDYETKEHVDRLESLVRRLSDELELPESQVNNLCLVAKLHDIGKITIPEYILKKPGALDATEWEYMKKHAETGYRLALSTNEFASIAEAILYHHEHWDGSGYPQGLTRYDIPLASRIIAIVDAFDVMIHDRPYKKAMSVQEAVNELGRCSGTQFDPQLVASFIKVLNSNRCFPL